MDLVASYLLQLVFTALLGVLPWALTYPWRRWRLAKKGLRAGPCREGMLLVFFLFLTGLLALTITPTGFWPALLRGERPQVWGAFQGGVNLVPIRRSWALFCYYVRHGLWGAIWINFPGNVVIFVPIGLFSSLLMDRPRWWKAALAALFLSAFIEVCQLFIPRGTDVDDLILNTLGGLLGYWAFLLLRKRNPGFVGRCGKLRKGSG